jgi:hypothetical protein
MLNKVQKYNYFLIYLTKRGKFKRHLRISFLQNITGELKTKS